MAVSRFPRADAGAAARVRRGARARRGAAPRSGGRRGRAAGRCARALARGRPRRRRRCPSRATRACCATTSTRPFVRPGGRLFHPVRLVAPGGDVVRRRHHVRRLRRQRARRGDRLELVHEPHRPRSRCRPRRSARGATTERRARPLGAVARHPRQDRGRHAGLQRRGRAGPHLRDQVRPAVLPGGRERRRRDHRAGSCTPPATTCRRTSRSASGATDLVLGTERDVHRRGRAASGR